ncbi:MAG: hypothetical protein ACFFFT_07980 [Candidatus Thorarchaeota archaeon]
MILYSVYENGALRKIGKVDFSNTKVYLIDDFKTIYLWYGSNSSKRKRDFSKKRADSLNSKRKTPAKIQIINQNKEYGSFLLIMDLLKEGLGDVTSLEKREELELEVEDTIELVESGLEMDLEAEITLATHKLSTQKAPYEDLSRQLATLQLTILKGNKKPTQAEITKKAKEILKSSSTYEELCWLISELEILMKKKHLAENL